MCVCVCVSSVGAREYIAVFVLLCAAVCVCVCACARAYVRARVFVCGRTCTARARVVHMYPFTCGGRGRVCRRVHMRARVEGGATSLRGPYRRREDSES